MTVTREFRQPQQKNLKMAALNLETTQENICTFSEIGLVPKRPRKNAQSLPFRFFPLPENFCMNALALNIASKEKSTAIR